MSRPVLAVAIPLLVLSGFAPSVAGRFSLISVGTEMRTVTVAMDSFDAYQVAIPGDKDGATVQFIIDSASATVDFYVLTDSGYVEYTDPNASSFHFVDESENARSFSYVTDRTGLIFVIDNARISTGGASPTGPVSYDLDVSFTSTGPTTTSLIIAGAAGAGVFGAIAATVLFKRRRRAAQATLEGPLVRPQENAMSFAAALPPSPMGPLPSGPANPSPPGGVAPMEAGVTRRPISDAEREALLRVVNDQGRRMIGLSIFMLGVALAYLVLPNLLTMVLSLMTFLGLAIGVWYQKLMRAIAAGQVAEFQGVPQLIGTRTRQNQTMFKLLFGSAPLSVSQRTYALLAHGQPNRLAVLEGANIAIAVNGASVSGFERVRLGVN